MLLPLGESLCPSISVFLFLFLSFNRCNSFAAEAVSRVELGGGGAMGGSSGSSKSNGSEPTILSNSWSELSLLARIDGEKNSLREASAIALRTTPLLTVPGNRQLTNQVCSENFTLCTAS